MLNKSAFSHNVALQISVAGWNSALFINHPYDGLTSTSPAAQYESHRSGAKSLAWPPSCLKLNSLLQGSLHIGRIRRARFVAKGGMASSKRSRPHCLYRFDHSTSVWVASSHRTLQSVERILSSHSSILEDVYRIEAIRCSRAGVLAAARPSHPSID